jgi:hypothetical protein
MVRVVAQLLAGIDAVPVNVVMTAAIKRCFQWQTDLAASWTESWRSRLQRYTVCRLVLVVAQRPSIQW